MPVFMQSYELEPNVFNWRAHQGEATKPGQQKFTIRSSDGTMVQLSAVASQTYLWH